MLKIEENYVYEYVFVPYGYHAHLSHEPYTLLSHGRAYLTYLPKPTATHQPFSSVPENLVNLNENVGE